MHSQWENSSVSEKNRRKYSIIQNYNIVDRWTLINSFIHYAVKQLDERTTQNQSNLHRLH